MTLDLITRLAYGDAAGSPHPHDLRRPVARAEAQQSYDSLFAPVDASEFSLSERWIIAAYTTALSVFDSANGADGADAATAGLSANPSADHTADHTAAFYAAGAAAHAPDAAAQLPALVAASGGPGPYGRYAELGLTGEDRDGVRLTVAHTRFGVRLAAALAHAQLLVKRPREADGAAQQRLLDAGWSPTGIVTLSQLVSFLAFQQRVVIGLRALTPKGLV